MAAPKFSFSGWNSSSLAPKVNPATVPAPSNLSTAAQIREKAQATGQSPVPPKESLAAVQAMPGGVQAWSAAIMAGKDPGVGTNPGVAAPGQTPDRTVYTDPLTGASKTQVDAGSTLVGTTNAANTNLPAWLQAEVDRINAQDALRAAALGGTAGAPAPNQNIGDILQGVAAVTAARGGYNTSLNQINEQARLQSLIQRRNQMRPVGGFGFNNPMDVPAQIGLDREIEAYRNVNLPLAAGAAGGARSSGWVNPFRTF